MPPDTESHLGRKSGKPLENQGIKRKLSLSDAPFVIRRELGEQLSEIERWPNQNIDNAIQQLEDAKGEIALSKSLTMR